MNKMNGSIVIIKTNYRMWVDKREELRNRLLKEAEEGLIIVDIPESEVHVVKQSDIVIGTDLAKGKDFVGTAESLSDFKRKVAHCEPIGKKERDNFCEFIESNLKK